MDKFDTREAIDSDRRRFDGAATELAQKQVPSIKFDDALILGGLLPRKDKADCSPDPADDGVLQCLRGDASETSATIRGPGWQCSIPSAASRRNVGPLPNWRLRRVIAFVQAHACNPLGLADLAQAAGLSRMHFAAQFRQATGLRPHEYLLGCRIERAKALLATSALPIAEVALVVGFSSQSHFSAVFKRFTGLTPYRWRSGIGSDGQQTEEQFSCDL